MKKVSSPSHTLGVILTCLVAGLIFISGSLFAQQADPLYQQGFNAYQSNDYLNAALNLFAYEQKMPGDLPSESRDQIAAALSYSQMQIQQALDLAKNGHVTSSTTKAEGMFVLIITNKNAAPDTTGKKKATTASFEKPPLPLRLISTKRTLAPSIFDKTERQLNEATKKCQLLQAELDQCRLENQQLKAHSAIK